VPIIVTFPTPQYPYAATGYADVASVQQNILGGSWDPAKPNAAPTVAIVQDHLRKATAMIDSELAARGYQIPLTPIPGYVVPTGFTAINGIHPLAYQMLEMVAAAYATSFVEGSRHASLGLEADKNAAYWMEIFDDFITRIASGADNLTAFGVQGPFPPEIDPAKAMQSGNLGAFVATGSTPSTTTEGPLFSRSTMNW
jgi:hypothetical protein